MDNAGGSVPAEGVVRRVADYMRTCMVQVGASYPLSEEATRRVAEGHRAAELLVGADVDEVVLGHSTTVNAKMLAAALRPALQPGDAIIVTNVDHESNRQPWLDLAGSGVELRTWNFRPDDFTLSVDDLEPLLDERVRLVCLSHCSNVFGAINDVEAICRAVHERGALVCVDGVAFAPHRRVRVHDWDVDFYLVSLYKVFGPHVGLLYGKREHLLAAKGQYNRCVPEDAVPYKLEPGNPTHELVAGVPGILEYLEALHDHHFDDRPAIEEKLDRAYALIADHEARLCEPLLDFLAQRSGVRIIGSRDADPQCRVPTIAFASDNVDPSALPTALHSARIAIRHGHFYAWEPVHALGLIERGGVVRVSMAHYNTEAEVARLIAALDTLI